jgi:hypothetical protein
VCYEWHQRPENILAGRLRWSDWRPPDRPDTVRVEHHKTGEEVWLPLEDGNEEGKELLFSEIESYLAELARLGPAIVMHPKRRVDSQAKKKEARGRASPVWVFARSASCAEGAKEGRTG